MKKVFVLLMVFICLLSFLPALATDEAGTLTLQAEETDDSAGISVKDTYIGSSDNGDYFGFQGVTMDGVEHIVFCYGVPEKYAKQTVEIRIDAPDGEIIGTFLPEATESFNDFTESKPVPVQPISGKHNLYFCFVGTEGVGNFDWVKLITDGSTTPTKDPSVPIEEEPFEVTSRLDVSIEADDAMVLLIGSPFAYINNQRQLVDTANIQVQPVIENDRTLVPARFISESMGALVSWEPETGSATVSQNGQTICFVIGSRQYTVNGEPREMDTEAKIINDRTFLPLRVMAETVGKKVFWDDKGLIVISNRENYFDSEKDAAKIDAIITAFQKRPRILVHSILQLENIGDIAQGPGMIALLEQYMPDADVTLWAGSMNDELQKAIQERFPNVDIVRGSLGSGGKASTEGLQKAIEESDFLLKASGPGVDAEVLENYVRYTGNPFGVYGITYSGGNQKLIEALGKADFVYFRDSVSLQKAKDDNINCPVMDFIPDSAFAFDMKDDASALAFLEENGLEEGKYVCVVPRLRFTPYWLIKNQPIIESNQAMNEKMKEHDHAKLLEAIIKIVRETDLKVLVCPEDATQMAVGKENIIDKLPEDVKQDVVWRETFWLPDEALAVHTRSIGLFGNEMHSPIQCVGNGIPAIVCRFSQQSSKGFMWQDIGLGDWLFDLDNETDYQNIVPTVMDLVQNHDQAVEKTKQAQQLVESLQRDGVYQLRRSIYQMNS